MGKHVPGGITTKIIATPPATSPAETVRISPEFLEIANCYLSKQSIQEVCIELDLPSDMVAETLNRKEVRAYINTVFADFGFNSRFKLNDLMDTIISKKLKDLDEADIGSEKDIIDILAFKHKMLMDQMAMEIKLIEAENKRATIKNQTNVQINDGNSNYGNLIERLMKGTK